MQEPIQASITVKRGFPHLQIRGLFFRLSTLQNPQIMTGWSETVLMTWEGKITVVMGISGMENIHAQDIIVIHVIKETLKILQHLLCLQCPHPAQGA